MIGLWLCLNRRQIQTKKIQWKLLITLLSMLLLSCCYFWRVLHFSCLSALRADEFMDLRDYSFFFFFFFCFIIFFVLFFFKCFSDESLRIGAPWWQLVGFFWLVFLVNQDDPQCCCTQFTGELLNQWFFDVFGQRCCAVVLINAT